MKTKTFSLFVLLCFFCSFQLAAQEGIKILHGPYLQNMSQEEVTIVWVTNVDAVSWVELAPDDGTHFYLKERPKIFAAKNGIKTEGRIHVVKLKGLTPATKYRYRVLSQEILSHNKTQITYGKVTSTATGNMPTFTTHDYTKGNMTFTLVSDIHERSEVFEQVLKLAEPLKNDLVFFNGDMMSNINNEKALFTGFMDVAVNAFAKNVPMYYARGNHETRGDSASSFQNYFSPLSPSLYFLVRQGPVCFVVMDSGEDKPDSDIEYGGITAFDAYRTEQAAWLKEALKSKEFQDAPFKVVVCHMPPLKDWHGQAEVLDKFVPLFNEAHVDIMLCGHMHKFSRHEATNELKFPVLINSNNDFVKGSATTKELTLEVVSFDGKKIDNLSIKK
jgi:Icc-related predicted phosphoesterase